MVDFRSLAVVDDGADARRALTQVKGVDSRYPLYGEIELVPPVELDDALAPRNGIHGAVLHPLLAEQLEIDIGDNFRLGNTLFRVSATILREPDATPGVLELGPRTIVYTNALADSGPAWPGHALLVTLPAAFCRFRKLGRFARRRRGALQGHGHALAGPAQRGSERSAVCRPRGQLPHSRRAGGSCRRRGGHRVGRARVH